MARTYLMNWDKVGFRWRRMLNGKMLRVSCDELGLPKDQWTQEASRELANAWWEERTGPDQLTKVFTANVGTPTPQAIKADLERLMALRALVAAGPIPKEITPEYVDDVLGFTPETDEQRIEFVTKFGDKLGTRTETEFSLDHHAENFLSLQLARGKKPRTWGELASIVRAFVKLEPLSPKMDVRKIDESTITAFYLATKKRERHGPQAKKVFGMFKRLVRYLRDNRKIPHPLNLDSRDFTFEILDAPIKVTPIKTIKETLPTLPDHLKLYGLLGLNCGMLGVDIGNLLKEECDLERGTITRKRTKTEAKLVKKTTYKLWPETLRLLKQFWSNHPTLALTSSHGTKLHVYEIKEVEDSTGKKMMKETEKDLIRQQWKFPDKTDDKKRLPFPHKACRTMASNVISKAVEHGGKIEYTPFYHYFLAHKPKSQADQSYAEPSQALFDEIVGWMGKVFGIGKETMPTPKKKREKATA